MFRKDAMPRACAVSFALATSALFWSLADAAEIAPIHPSTSVLQLRQSSQELAARSRAIRDESAGVVARLRTSAPKRHLGRRETARSQHFSVSAPATERLSESVLAAAEKYRREIALAWLGQELPAGCEPTIIHVELTENRDVGLAMLDEGRPELRNRIWLQTSPARAVGSTLAHEVAHVVLSARFPVNMPVWATEGIACQYDDATRSRRRKQLRRQFVRTGHWPSLHKLLTTDTIVPTDETSYVAAVSLTEYLVTLADRQTFVKFVADGQNHGWDTALKRHYDIVSVQELEAHWHAAVTAELSTPQRMTATSGRWVPISE